MGGGEWSGAVAHGHRFTQGFQEKLVRALRKRRAALDRVRP